MSSLSFMIGLGLGGVGGGTIGFVIAATLSAASKADDVSEYHGAHKAVREHLEDQETKKQATQHLHQWANESEA